eukprot:267943_1
MQQNSTSCCAVCQNNSFQQSIMSAETSNHTNLDCCFEWCIGSELEIYSRSDNTWYPAVVIDIIYNENGEWLRIKYGHKKKSIQRLCKDIRPNSTLNKLNNIQQNQCESIADCKSLIYIINALKYVKYNLHGSTNSTLFNESNLAFHMNHFLKFHVNNESKTENKNDDMKQIVPINNLPILTANNNKNGSVEYSWNEISKHNNPKDLWLVYNNKIFDMSSFLRFHPGGVDVILRIAEKTQDITDIFHKLKHPPITNNILIKHYIGNVIDKTNVKRMSLHLDQFIKHEGIWNAKNGNLSVNSNEKIMSLTDHYIIQWS